MSDRGSFVTEYIYCRKCFEAAKTILIGQEKYLTSTTIPHWSPDQEELPIIAGKIGGQYSGEEIDTFKYQFIPQLEDVICCRLRIAVLAEEGEEILFAVPSQKAVEKKIEEMRLNCDSSE